MKSHDQELLEEEVELRVGGGFISQEFNDYYFKENWFRYNRSGSYWYKTVKKSKVSSIQDFIKKVAPKFKKSYTPEFSIEKPNSTKR